MIMAGKNVTQVGDTLTPLSLERMYQSLIQPKENIQQLIFQLRSLKSMDPNGYRRAKTKLPYVVCGYFNPPIRRKENFAWIEHFIIDLDKLSSHGHSIDGVKAMLEKDDRIALLFTSPGNDGIKAVLNLSTRIHDAGYYSHFYKIFTARFARQYRLEGVVDLVTNDVSRCCFMSVDPNAIYNANAVAIDPGDYLNSNSVEELFSLQPEIKEYEETRNELKKATLADPTSATQDLEPDILQRIKLTLNPALEKRVKAEKEYIQPQQLDEAMPFLQQKLLEIGIRLTEVKKINYGRQLKVVAVPYWAELNLFYGKQGFKVVKTTKTGSNKELAELAENAILMFLQDIQLNIILNANA